MKMWIIILLFIVALVVIFVPFGKKEDGAQRQDVQYKTEVIPVPPLATPANEANVDKNTSGNSASNPAPTQNQDLQENSGASISPQVNLNQETLRVDNAAILQAWVVEVAKVDTDKEAIELTEYLQNKQYRAFLRARLTPQGDTFHILVGPETQKIKAEQLKEHIMLNTSLKGTVIAYRPIQQPV